MTATESVTAPMRSIARFAHPPVRTVSYGVRLWLIGHAVPVVTLGVLDDRLSTSVLIVGFAAFATAVLTVPVRAFRHHGGRLHGEALS
jgi:hypothetical protein